MLRLEGDKDFPQSLTDLWAKLNDAGFLASCVPGVDSVAQADTDKATCTLRPGFTFVRGNMELTIQITERKAEQTVRAQLRSKGIGSSSDVEATLTLNPLDSGTRLHWVADVTALGGLLRAVPSGLIKAAAQKVVMEALAIAEAKLTRSGGSS
jgi:carbon monoxide dehydrogenase subunit G